VVFGAYFAPASSAVLSSLLEHEATNISKHRLVTNQKRMATPYKSACTIARPTNNCNSHHTLRKNIYTLPKKDALTTV